MKPLLVLLASCSLALAQTASTDTLVLGDLIRFALRDNLELHAYTQRHHALEARVPQMSALDPPRLTFEVEEDPAAATTTQTASTLLRNNALAAPTNGDHSASGTARHYAFGLEQMLPFPGKLNKAKKLAEIEVEHAHHELAEKALDVIAQLKAAYFELYMIQRGLAVNHENLALMTQFVNIAQVRYAVGQVMHQDVLKANVELARLANERITLQQQEETMKAMLNVLLNRAPQSPLGQAIVPKRDSLVFELTTLQEVAFSSRPMLHHDSLSITQSRVAHSLARQEYWPDFGVALKYRIAPAEDFRGFSAMAGVNLPFAFWSIKKPRGRIAETEAELRRNEAMFANTRNMILFAVQEALLKVQSAQRTVALYRKTILPQAEQALQTTLANYQTRQTDFLMLLDSYRMLQMSKMEYYEAQAKFEMSLAELERAVGQRLE